MRNLFSGKEIIRFSMPFLLAVAIAALAGCGGAGSGAAGTSAAATTTAASLSLSATPTTVKSDNSTTTTVTLTALTASNAAVPDVTVTLSADTGILGAATVTTGTTGQATFTFQSGTVSKANRTATITATAGTVTGQLPVQIVGSTLSANPSSGISIPDDGTSPATVTFTAKDSGGNPVSGAAITLIKTGTGNITFIPASGTTDINGQLAVTVAGVAGGAGAAVLTATALGATASASIAVSTATATFAITNLTLNGTPLTSAATNSYSATAMKTISDSLVVTVTAPAPTTSVTFASTMGTWTVSGTTTQTVAVVAGTASATLTTAAAGLANVQVIDANPLNPPVSDTLTVSMTAATAAVITLQASPSVVPKSVGTTTGTSILIATVTDASNQPVGGAPVAFSILNSTGGGENVSPVVAYTASTPTASLSLGQALTTFTSGSLSSGAGGVQIRAQVLGTGVVTEAAGVNLTSSGNDAAVVIGGSAGSVAFGQATVLGVNSNATAYILAMSVMVADSNGNPAPLGTVVNLSLWPIAWSTGSGCAADYTNGAIVSGLGDTATTGTFLNEDANENLVLDTVPPEDGTRIRYYGGATVGGGTKDTYITPPNSAAGTLPASVTTDKNGVATFDLTYPKTSAIWNVIRIRARTLVQGSDAVGEVKFRLAPSVTDVTPTTCLLPPSPYSF